MQPAVRRNYATRGTLYLCNPWYAVPTQPAVRCAYATRGTLYLRNPRYIVPMQLQRYSFTE